VLFGRLVALVLTMLWMPSAHTQDFTCQPGQTRVLRGGGYQCQCPDGTYAAWLSPCPSQKLVPSIDFDSPSTPHESLLQAAQQRIREIANSVRLELFGSAPLSSSISNQPTTIASPKGYSASFEQQPKAPPPDYSHLPRLPESTNPRAAAQPNNLLNKTPIAATPATQSSSPSKGSVVNCGVGQRLSAKGNFCELDPNLTPSRPVQSQPTGSYAACVALRSNTGAFATGSQPPSCVMDDGSIYYSDGRMVPRPN